MESTQNKEPERVSVDVKQAMERLSQLVSDGFLSQGMVLGSLREIQLSDIERDLEDAGWVTYSYNDSFGHEKAEPAWDYLVTKSGMKFYNQYGGRNE